MKILFETSVWKFEILVTSGQYPNDGQFQVLIILSYIGKKCFQFLYTIYMDGDQAPNDFIQKKNSISKINYKNKINNRFNVL